MSVDIGYHKFICDTCGKEVFAKDHPEGWKWLKPRPESDILKTEHACEECVKSIPVRYQGTWGCNE
jgi:hypothetical protein